MKTQVRFIQQCGEAVVEEAPTLIYSRDDICQAIGELGSMIPGLILAAETGIEVTLTIKVEKVAMQLPGKA